MNYQLIPEFLKSHIIEKPNITSGIEDLDTFLRTNFSFSFKESVSPQTLLVDFQKKLEKIIRNNKIGSKVTSLFFGLLSINENGKEITVIHLSGSKQKPEDDDDWACDTDYSSGSKFIKLSEFVKLDDFLSKKVDDNNRDRGAIEVIIFNGLLNLLIINSKDVLKGVTLKSGGLFPKTRKELWIGSGYNSGDCYVVDKINYC